MDWYALNGSKSVWRRAAGVYIRILSEPQLFIEGNHRTGALIMTYLLAREGRPPFVLTEKNAREYFNPSSVFKKTNKHSVMIWLKMPGLTSAFADYLKRQANKAFLSSMESFSNSGGEPGIPERLSWVRIKTNSDAGKTLASSNFGCSRPQIYELRAEIRAKAEAAHRIIYNDPRGGVDTSYVRSGGASGPR